MTDAALMTHLLPALRECVGPDGLREAAATAAYSLDGVEPWAAVVPCDEDEASRALALASEHGLAVVPWGGGAHQSVGHLPTRYDLALDLRRMNQIRAYEPADMTVTVHAGATVADLQRVLAEADQFFPLDPPLPDRATIGGVVAANLNGPLRCRYGTVRDLVLGMRVAHADGTITKAGARVVKNATAYDVTKLHVGAHGTLGVVLEATLRVQPRPALERGWWLVGAPVEECQTLATRLLGSHLAPNRLEVIVGDGRAICGSPEPGPALMVSFAGVQDAVEDQAAALDGLARRAGFRIVAIENGPAVWRMLQDFPWGFTMHGTAFRIAWRASVLPSDCAKTMQALAAGIPPTGMAMAATVAHGVLRGEICAARPDDLVVRLREAREAVSGVGGFLVVTAAPAPIRGAVTMWGPTPGDAALMRQLKAAFDPRGVLNPGRFIDGL